MTYWQTLTGKINSEQLFHTLFDQLVTGDIDKIPEKTWTYRQ